MSDSLGPETAEDTGFEPPHLRQFTVFMDNRVGRLQSLMRHLEAAAGPVVALAIEESADNSLVRLICFDPDVGREVLTNEGYAFSESDVLAVEMPGTTKQPLSA